MLDIMTIRDSLIPVAESFGIKKVYLFGSYATGTATKDSDIDLLIEKGEPLSLLKLSDMRQQCQEILNCPVDLLTTTGVGEDFYKEIEGTEVLLYEA